VHIIAELIDTDTGLSRWSSHYAVGTDELFAVRLRMIEDLAGAIGTRLSPAGNATAESGPDAAEAYAFYIRAMDIFGQDYLGNRTTARTLLDQAIALDPDLSYAYAGKAVVHVFSAINSGDAGVELSVAEHAALAHDYIERALGIEPQTDLAHYAAGVLEMFSWNFPAARESLSRAVEITPQHGTFLAQLGWLEVCGLGLADGLRHAERAAMIDPQNAYVFERLSATLNCAGDLPAALAATERALSLDPTLFQNQLAQAILTGFVHGEARGRDAFRRLQPMLTEARLLTLPAVALAYSRLGLDDDARRLFERFSAAAESRRTGPANWYMAYLAVGDYDRAYEMLAQAIADRHLGPGFYTLMSFLNNPGSPAPFDEPRFLALRDALRASARVAGSRAY
jgi:adenylate cyclase